MIYRLSPNDIVSRYKSLFDRINGIIFGDMPVETKKRNVEILVRSNAVNINSFLPSRFNSLLLQQSIFLSSKREKRKLPNSINVSLINKAMRNFEKLDKKVLRYSTFYISLMEKKYMGEIIKKMVRINSEYVNKGIKLKAVTIEEVKKTKPYLMNFEKIARLSRYIINRMTVDGFLYQSNLTLREIQERMRKEVINIFGSDFVEIGNRRYDIEYYTRLVTLTEASFIQNKYKEKWIKENDFPFVKASSHFGACDICSGLQDQIYSVRPETGYRFPYPPPEFPIHPHCFHFLEPLDYVDLELMGLAA